MANKTLAYSVTVTNPETNEPETFLAGSEPPAWAQETITNKAAWEANEPADSISIDFAKSSVDDIEAWVGDDPLRAAQALTAEGDRAKPRTSLVAKLEEIANRTE